MIQIVILALGAVCLVIGIMRISKPEEFAKTLAAKEDDYVAGEPPAERFVKKAKSNSISLIAMSVLVLAIGVGISFM